MHSRLSLRLALPSVAIIACLLCAPGAEAQSLRVEQTDGTIELLAGDSLILAYNKVSPPVPEGIDPLYRRSGCLHPVCTPAGRTVTTMFPYDHAHQHGIFSAWVRTKYDGRDVDFWNMAKGTGRVLHNEVVSVFQKGNSVGFEVDLIHRALSEPATDVLNERWKITAHATDGSYHCFDLESVQTALTSKPLKIRKYHYGGHVLRGPTRWLTAEDKGRIAKEQAGSKQPADALEPSDFLNDLGSSREAGNHEHAKWVSLWGEIDGQPVSITVLGHKDNFRAPQAARLHPTKPYFCFAPCVDDEFIIDKKHPLKARYRYLVTDAMPDSKWLEEQWQQWCGLDSDQAAAEETRRYRIGFTGFPYDISLEAVAQAHKYTREYSDIIAHHIEGVPWAESLAGQPYSKPRINDWTGKRSAKPKDGKVYLAVSPGRGDLKVADDSAPLPDELKGKPYNHPLVKKAYLAYCRRMVEFFQPDFLSIGIETNELFYEAGPDVWKAYVELHQHVYDAIKKERPQLPIFASFTVHNMLNVQGDERRKRLEAFLELMPYNDRIAISYYPFIQGADTDVDAAFEWVEKTFDKFGKRYLIAETAEAAERLPLSSFGVVINGTPAKQDKYLKQLTEFAQSHETDFVIWFLHRDYDAMWEKIKDSVPEAFKAWRDCGLLDEAGNERPSHTTWMQTFERPLQEM